jgi:hypothetical protein
MRCPLCRLVTIGDDDYDNLDGQALSSSPPASTRKRARHRPERSAGRLRLLDANVTIFETIAPQLGNAAIRRRR